MVLLSLDRPFTVHARSIDRQNGDVSEYELGLRDPIRCNEKHYMVCTLVSAKIPMTFYTIDDNNRTFSVTVNRSTESDANGNQVQVDNLFNQFKGIALESFLTTNYPNNTERADFQRTVNVTIKKGNYDIESLLLEVKTQMNIAFAVANMSPPFVTFLRAKTGTLHTEDFADSEHASALASNQDYIFSSPEFDWKYDKQLNKARIFRTDEGGKMALGKFDISIPGPKLQSALGFLHITAKDRNNFNLSAEQKTMSEDSHHYRETSRRESTSGMELYTPATDGTEILYGHTVFSSNCVNMMPDDSVYLHIPSLPPNSYETLNGNLGNCMGVIPMYSGTYAESFHTPQNPTASNLGNSSVSSLRVRLTDADGVLLSFNGVEHEFQLKFEAFEQGTRKDRPDDEMHRLENERNRFGEMHGATGFNTRRTHTLM